MIVGTAGHVDHGKTALVRALTGVDTDRLAEEKRRGITIELGFAYLPADGEPIGFVDVPGHERLVHTMVAGAAGIDFVLLVIAADDGPMPQTREHLQVMQLLGLDRGLVAMTKVDKVEPDLRHLAREEVRELLTGTFLATSEILDVSALTGEGVEALKQKLVNAAAATPARPATGRFRMAVDRRFTLPGIGTVVTGTARAGAIAVGDHVRLPPHDFEARVRSIHANGREVASGRSGQRCALALAGSGFGREDLHRGDWAVAPDAVHLTDRLDVALSLAATETRPLAGPTSVHLHIGASDLLARVTALEPRAIEPGEAGFARLLLPHPIHAVSQDRFILRDTSARRTLGGGMVLDPAPPQRASRKPERLDLLAAWKKGPAAALNHLLQTSSQGVDLAKFGVSANLRPDEIDALISSNRIVTVGKEAHRVAFTRAHWLEARKTVRGALLRIHRRAPQETGANAETLRKAAVPGMAAATFDHLLGEMREAGVITATGPWLHLPDHRVEEIASELALWKDVRALLARDILRPERARTFGPALGVDDERVLRILKRQVLAGEAFAVAEDYYLLPEGVRALAAIVAEEAAADGFVTAAMLRDRLETGRKMAIWMLEMLDRQGYCRRVGDTHAPTGRTIDEVIAAKARSH